MCAVYISSWTVLESKQIEVSNDTLVILNIRSILPLISVLKLKQCLGHYNKIKEHKNQLTWFDHFFYRDDNRSVVGL
jgi:hypothetical protein